MLDLDYQTRAEKGSPLTTAEIDGIFSSVRTAVNELNAAVADGVTISSITQDDDGAIIFTLSDDRTFGPFPMSQAPFRPRGAWTTTLNYAVGDFVSNAGSSYVAMTAHTAGADFAVDLAAGKWMLVAQSGTAGDTQDQIDALDARVTDLESGGGGGMGVWPVKFEKAVVSNGLLIGHVPVFGDFEITTDLEVAVLLGTAPGIGKTITVDLKKNGTTIGSIGISDGADINIGPITADTSFSAPDRLSAHISSADVGAAADISVIVRLQPA